MLINDNKVLQNDGRVFKSQAVSSYLQTCQTSTYMFCICVDGVSMDDPFKFYLERPTAMSKTCFTNNGLTLNGIDATGSGYKNVYTFGNTNAVKRLDFPFVSCERGDLFGFMNQFPNLETICFGQSAFNCDLSYSSFPKNLKNFQFYDPTVTGCINTWKNTENIECIRFLNSQLCGSISELNLTKLKDLNMQFSWNLSDDLNKIFNDNPDLSDLIYYPNSFTVANWSGIDISGLRSLSYYEGLPIPGVSGNISGWTFNSGLTSIYFMTRSDITGDITNWDVSNTNLNNLSVNSYVYNSITGSLSGWTLNSEIQTINLLGLGITSLPPFPQTMTYQIVIQVCDRLTTDINTIVFPTGITYIAMNGNSLTGDIGGFTIPSETVSLSMIDNNLSGNISGLTINNKISSLQLYSNSGITGSLVDMMIPDSMNDMYLGGTGIYIDFDAGTFDVNKIKTLSLQDISGITGNLANLILPDDFNSLIVNYTPIDSDLSRLDISHIKYLQMAVNPLLHGDITNWLTGATNVIQLQIGYNAGISGNTSNWNVSGTTVLSLVNDGGLYGALKHPNPYYLEVTNTNISSNIETDFDFTKNASDVRFTGSKIIGNLSGVTFNSGIFRFFIDGCTGVTGSNFLIDYLFVNKKYFTNPTGFYIYMNGIGDAVTGTSQTLGDLGTWGGSQWDLTEEQVNNLAVGTDYTGAGSNTPWDSKQKIYWMMYAETSSTNPARRYILYYILY
jgi:hypothetical protein